MTEIHPREQEKLWGHDEIRHRLKAAYDAGRLHHTLIFAGNEGVGKETLAYHFMRYALVNPHGNPRQDDFTVDPEHRAVRQIIAESHPQLLVIEPVYDDKKGKYARDITLDALKGLSDFLRLAPTDDSPRFILINPAESLNRNAQNALLKVLEEPPQRTYFILITTQIGALLPTIRSRCMAIHFDGLAEESFKQAAKVLLPEANKAEVESYFKLTNGAIGHAITYHQQDVLKTYDTFCKALVAWGEGDTVSAMRVAEQLGVAAEEQTSSQIIELILTRLARFLKERVANTATATLTESEAGVFEQWQTASPEQLLLRYDQVQMAWKEASFSYLDKKLVLMTIFGILSGSDSKKSTMMP